MWLLSITGLDLLKRQLSAALLITLWWEPGSQEVKPWLPSPMWLQKKPKLLSTVGWIKCLSALMHLILSLSTLQLWENLSPVVKLILGAKGNFCQRPRVICTIRIQQLSAAVFGNCVSYKTKKASCHPQKYWCKDGKRGNGQFRQHAEILKSQVHLRYCRHSQSLEDLKSALP